MRWQAGVLIGILWLAALAPAPGAVPKVTLRLEEVTCREAALALERATGVPLELRPRVPSDIPGAVEAPVKDLNERASFNWENLTFAAALHQLADRYHLLVMPGPGGAYHLTQWLDSYPPPTYGNNASVEAGGMRILVRSVGFGESSRNDNGSRVNIQIQGRALDGDATQVTALENLSGRDDRGNLLTFVSAHPMPVFQEFPDTWTAHVLLSGRHPASTRLAWIGGDVLVSRLLSPQQCESPLPLPEKAIHQLRNVRVEFLRFTPAQPMLFVNESERNFGGPSLRVRVEHPNGMNLASPTGALGTAAPTLVGMSGQSYSASQTSAQTRFENGVQISEMEFQYPALPEPVRQVRYRFAERQPAERLCTFRINDVPLPTGPYHAGNRYYGDFEFDTFGPQSSHYAPGGAALLLPVQIPGRGVPEGRLTVGLAPANGAGRTEWYELKMGAAGICRLEGVRPGSYRVLRVYSTLDYQQYPTGWWRNGEVVVRVAGEKEVRLPPLQLSDGTSKPEAAPAPIDRRNDGASATLSNLSLSCSRQLTFSEPPRTTFSPSLNLELSGLGKGAPPERVFGVRNLVARDDRGNLLTLRTGGRVTTTPDPQGFTWKQEVSLNAPHPQARQLAWLEGDLMAFDTVKRFREELPVPSGPEPVKKEVEGISFEIDSLTSLAIPAGENPATTQWLLRGRVFKPDSTRFRGPEGPLVQPVLIGKSGVRYDPVKSHDSTGPGRWEIRCRYEADEPIARIEFDVMAWTDLHSIGSFRLTRVPLPTLAGTPTAEEKKILPLEIEALRQEGGAVLELPVQQNGAPAPDGLLTLGLAPRVGDRWGTVRWTRVEISGGAARVGQIKPGSYRVLRTYRPHAVPPTALPGRWEGGTVELTLTAGRETAAPPLRWLSNR